MHVFRIQLFPPFFFSFSIDSETLRRRKRDVNQTGNDDNITLQLEAHGNLFSFSVQHTVPVLHPQAAVYFSKGDFSEVWTGNNPNCFLTGKLTSHGDETAVFSFCNNLVYTLYFQLGLSISYNKPSNDR